MPRRKAVNTSVLEKLIRKQEQSVKDFQVSTVEFLKHCKIKGLSPDTIKFYDKELKGLFRAFVELDISLSDIRELKTKTLRIGLYICLNIARLCPPSSKVESRENVHEFPFEKELH